MKNLKINEFKDFIRNIQTNDSIVYFGIPKLEALSSKRLSSKKILLIETFDNKIDFFFLEFVKKFLNDSTPKQIDVYNKLKKNYLSLKQKKYRFDYFDEVTSHLLNTTKKLLDDIFKDYILVFNIDNLIYFDKISFLLVNKIINENSTKFFNTKNKTEICRYMFIFNYKFKIEQLNKNIEKFGANLVELFEIVLSFKLWKKSEKLAEIIDDLKNYIKDNRVLGAIYFRTGMLYERKGMYQKAKHLYQLSKNKFDKNGSEIDLLKSLNNLGNVYSYFCDYKSAKNCFKKALSISEKIRNEHSLSIVYGSMGNVHVKLGDYKQAIDFLKKSLLFIVRGGNFYRVQIIYNYLGDAYLKLNDKKTALTYYKEAYEFSKLENEKIDQGVTKLRLGQYYLEDNDYKQAESEFKEAEQIYKSFDNDYGLMLTYKNLGKLYMLKKNKKLSEQYYKKHIKLADYYKKNDLIKKAKKKLKRIKNNG